jgi:hypothetical protein
MGVRLPLTTVLDYNDAGQTGATSVAGGVAKTFTIPQDADNVVVKLTASVIAGGVSATFQTTDDGGTTWYDVARTSIVSNANNTTADWLSIPVISPGMATAVNGFPTASILTVGIGSAAASTLGVRQISGLPILSQTNRVFLRYTAAVTSTDLARVQVKVNSESGTS